MKLRVYFIGSISFFLWLVEMGVGALLTIVYGRAFLTVPSGTVSVAPGFYLVLCLFGVILLMAGGISLRRAICSYRQAVFEGRLPQEMSCVDATLWIFYRLLLYPWLRLFNATVCSPRPPR